MKESSYKAQGILNVASSLFNRKGYNATSLKEIADKVGLHKSSLFHYFRNKEEILIEIMDRSLKANMNIFDDSIMNSNLTADEIFRVVLERQISVICKYRNYINVYLNEIGCLSPENKKQYSRKRRQYRKKFEKLVREIQTSKNTACFKGLDPKVITFGILGMCNWMINWYRKDGNLTPKEISDIFYSLIMGKAKK